jgi:pimeloyl-ACP methyl ester carboxylesterase
MTTGLGPDRVHVIDRGAKHNPPLLLVHGWGVTSEALIECIDCLAEHHRVIAPDLPGFGRSPPLSPPLTYAAYADVLARLLTDLDIERADVAGFSMGGGVALTFAARYPERLRKLVLIAPSGCLDAQRSFPRQAADYVWESMLELAHRREWLGKRRVAKSFFGHLLRRPATMLVTMRMVGSQSVVEHAAEVKAPTLLLWGERDHTIPLRLASQFLERLADGTLHTVQGSYHDVVSTRPRQTAATIHGFLQEPIRGDRRERSPSG